MSSRTSYLTRVEVEAVGKGDVSNRLFFSRPLVRLGVDLPSSLEVLIFFIGSLVVDLLLPVGLAINDLRLDL